MTNISMADAIEAVCLTTHGTEYGDWPPQAFADYAEHMMLALAAMSDEQLAVRYAEELDPRTARDEDLAYWTSIVRAA
jgi:hypothetical protein